jgi:hypothetical protein
MAPALDYIARRCAARPVRTAATLAAAIGVICLARPRTRITVSHKKGTYRERVRTKWDHQ